MNLSKAIEVLTSLNELSSIKLPVTVSFRVAKAIALLQPELALYDKQRLSLAEELGVKTEDGTQFTFDADNGKSFVEQMEKLLQEEVPFTLPTFSEADLTDVTIEPRILVALMGTVIV